MLDPLWRLELFVNKDGGAGIFCSLLAVGLSVLCAAGQLRGESSFWGERPLSDGMVLQQRAPLSVWGLHLHGAWQGGGNHVT